jgi:beta-galactosidase
MRFSVPVMICLVFAAMYSAPAARDGGRWEQALSGPGWKLSLDRDAQWRNDTAYLPPVDISQLPVHPPSSGWDALKDAPGMVVSVPGTVEEYYWGLLGGESSRDGSGDYVGVSWWSRTFAVPPKLQGKRITLAFESVNLRAEVFVNEKLVGYDVIGNTPFEVDATNAIVFDRPNRLDIRITDPVGNFNWNDNPLMAWGDNMVPAVHGFGGITGSIILRATDSVYVADIYVQNKPDPAKAEVFVTLNNRSGRQQEGSLTLTVHEWKNPSAVVFRKTAPVTVPSEGLKQAISVSAPTAKLWKLSPYRTLKEAALYEARVDFAANDRTIGDETSQRFGFRYFAVGERNGDKRFYLNGKRVFTMAAMTRGFWPKNGIFPTPEMARRDLETMVDLGYNMMLMHRAIGQPAVFDYADRYGLLTYEEPGGYRITAPGPNRSVLESGLSKSEMGLRWREEKARRMVIRDRSNPSLIIYNLKNEAESPPDAYDIADIRMLHALDPSRIITYNSDRNRQVDYSVRVANDPYKLYMRPFDDTMHHDWFDQHHWFSFPGYVDTNYNNPRHYLRGVVDAPRTPVPADSLNRLDPSEIIFWGEEGAWGTMVRLGAIHDELMHKGEAATGFREMEHVAWYDRYDRFLDDSGFRESYPTVDALTLEIGRNLHYFHGRSLENIRMSNIADGININGWAAESTRTDLVDMYRYPTGDPSILQHYSQPLYVAVKIRAKSVPVGTTPVADFFIINELDLKGPARLEVTFDDPSHKTIFNRSFDVDVLGGEEFGQLLVEGVALPAVPAAGRYVVNARIVQDASVKCTGCDDVCAADFMRGPGIKGRVAVLDSTGIVKSFLKAARNVTAVDYEEGIRADIIIVGPSDRAQEFSAGILKLAAAGSKVIVLDNAQQWVDAVNGAVQGPAPFSDNRMAGMRMGRFFMNKGPYFEGLPQAQSMGWEYQFFYRYGNPQGLNVNGRNAEYIVAACAPGTPDIVAGIAGVTTGKGCVLLSALDFMDALASDLPQSAVPKKLFMNLVEQK